MPVLEAHDSHIYVFNGKWLWRLNDWAVDSGYPRLARKVFQRAPTNIGAAVYSWRTRYTYFFKGESAFTGIVACGCSLVIAMCSTRDVGGGGGRVGGNSLGDEPFRLITSPL